MDHVTVVRITQLTDSELSDFKSQFNKIMDNQKMKVEVVKEMKPTVGRIVYYKSYGTPNGEYKPEDRAAVVTGVVDDETVHLCVLNPTGMFFNLNVKQGQNGGQWDWMPYQKQQATQIANVLMNATNHPAI